MPSLSARRALLAAVLLVAGCNSPPPRPTYPDLHFTDRLPIKLDVARIDVQMAYQAPFRAPNVDQSFAVPPSHAMENWARDRLRAAGRTGRAIFTVRNASVIETELPKTEGLRGALTTEPAQRYDLALEASLQVLDANGLERRSTSVNSNRSQGVLEGITPNERDQAWYDMTKAAMADFDAQMEANIRKTFGDFIVP